MADSELIVTAKFDANDVEPAEIDHAITEAIKELRLIKSVSIEMTYSLRYHGVVQR